MNIKSDIGANFKDIPAIDSPDGTLICDRCFVLPPTEVDKVKAFKTSDITIDLADEA